MKDEKYKFLIDNQEKIEELATRFGSYVTRVDKNNINRFLTQFEIEHLQVALKLLDNVDYYDGTRRLSLLKDLCGMVLAVSNTSLENVVFCPLNPFSADSSDQIHRIFRNVMKGRAKNCRNYNKKFIHMNDLEDLNGKPYTVFFVDDFIGSGQSVIEHWGTIQHYEDRDNHTYYFAVMVAYKEAIDEIRKQTFEHFEIITSRELTNRNRAFHKKSKIFTDKEKEILKEYCKRISSSDKHRYGHNNTQSLVVFQDRAPNNVIPILKQNTNNWYPLFPRFY
ncbi:MAG: hypothetical protein HYY67_02125 [Thaumarchaeota archaeon]|nr:hypothetical protein [Nitrososphaerota archaeon]